MILQNQQSDIQLIGDIQEYKTSIDPKNLDIITTLLSSNLYSKPEDSFIREIVSNAWDSHVEARTTDIPIIIKVTENSISIRDFGTGLSPERFKEIYCNIGSSTKRESNNFIGCFGIGRFSIMACTSIGYITSYYNGKQYSYVMTKDTGNITINLVSTINTDEKNGLEVTIKGTDLYRFSLPLRKLLFFPNIYIDNTISDFDYNTYWKIVDYHAFKAANYRTENIFLLGNVLYPCTCDSLSKEAKDFLASIVNKGIFIKFNIGELDVTPNREDIIYTNRSIEIIEKRLKEAKKELDDIVTQESHKNYNNVLEYLHVANKKCVFNLLSDKEIACSSFGYPCCISSDNIQLYGYTLNTSQIDIIKNVLYCSVTHANGLSDNAIRLINNNRIITQDYKTYYQFLEINKKYLVISGTKTISPTLRKYLIENFQGYYVICDDSILTGDIGVLDRVFTTIINSDFKAFNNIRTKITKEFVKNAIVLDVKTDREYLKFKKKKTKTSTQKDIKIVMYSNVHYKTNIHNASIYNSIKLLKHSIKTEIRGGILLTDSRNLEVYKNLADFKGFNLCQAPKTLIPKILQEIPNRFVTLEDIFKDRELIEFKLLGRVKCELSSYDIPVSYFKVRNLLPYLPESIKQETILLIKILQKFNPFWGKYLGIENISTINKKSMYDSLITKLVKYEEAIQKVEKLLPTALLQSTQLNVGSSNIFLTKAIIKTKAFRVGAEAYNTMINNDLIKLLCKK